MKLNVTRWTEIQFWVLWTLYCLYRVKHSTQLFIYLLRWTISTHFLHQITRWKLERWTIRGFQHLKHLNITIHYYHKCNFNIDDNFLINRSRSWIKSWVNNRINEIETNSSSMQKMEIFDDFSAMGIRWSKSRWSTWTIHSERTDWLSYENIVSYCLFSFYRITVG